VDTAQLQQRLTTFIRHHMDDPGATVSGVEKAPGHAGFSFFFVVTSHGLITSYWMRLPPPGVKLEGTADVLRQVAALKALNDTGVPHAPVLWSGDDPVWFGAPYFVTPRLDGEPLRGPYLESFTREQRWDICRQTMTAIAGVHRVDPSKAAYLGDFWGFEFDVTRWDRFAERAAEPQLLALQPRVREALLARIPTAARIGIYHGDFQFSNILVSRAGKVIALIDWELTGIGATLNDLGWVCAFHEPQAWVHAAAQAGTGLMPHADEFEAWYSESWGAPVKDLAWFKALALYKFGTITGFNLMLHRRGKRDDPHWEDIAPSMQSNMEHALRLLDGMG